MCIAHAPWVREMQTTFISRPFALGCHDFVCTVMLQQAATLTTVERRSPLSGGTAASRMRCKKQTGAPGCAAMALRGPSVAQGVPRI